MLTIVAMWLFGLIGVLYGLRLESSGWWDERPFATNMFSALVGASFGIPVAVILIQQLSVFSGRAIADARHEAAVAISAGRLQTQAEIVIRALTEQKIAVQDNQASIIQHNQSVASGVRPPIGMQRRIKDLDWKTLRSVPESAEHLQWEISQRDNKLLADYAASLAGALGRYRQYLTIIENQQNEGFPNNPSVYLDALVELLDATMDLNTAAGLYK